MKSSINQEYQVLVCENCGKEFVFSSHEEALYNERNLENPKFCPICRGLFEAEKKHSQEEQE